MLTVQVSFTVKAEHLETFKAALLANASASVHEVGVVRFDVFQDTADPTRFTLIEVYRDLAARQAHMETEHFKQWRAVLASADILVDRQAQSLNALFPATGLFPYPLPPYRWEKPGEVSAADPVSLVEITNDNLGAVLGLHVDAFQRRFVADNPRSLAQAALEPKAWYRAVYAGNTPVGFLMNLEDTEKPFYYLWRFMIDYRYQGLGIGRRALELAIARVRTLPNAAEYYLSYVPAPGCPREFYQKLGFVETGVEEDGELEMKLVL